MESTDKTEKPKEQKTRAGNAPTNESASYLLCRTPSFDCRIDERSCVEGAAVRNFESKQEALEALRDEWEEGTCF